MPTRSVPDPLRAIRVVRAAAPHARSRRRQRRAAQMVAVHVIERTAALNSNPQPAKAVVADGGGCAVGRLLFVVGEEGVGRRAAAHLPDARAARVVPVPLLRVAAGVLHLRQPVLRVPNKRLLAG